jgi:hypothetical protein
MPGLLTVATVNASDAQALVSVTSCVVLSLNVPVATNLCVVAVPMEALPGVTATDEIVALDTVRSAVFVVDGVPRSTVMLDVPVPWLTT